MGEGANVDRTAMIFVLEQEREDVLCFNKR